MEGWDCDQTSVEELAQMLDVIIQGQGYTCVKLCSCDEAKLNFKMLPDKSLISKEEFPNVLNLKFTVLPSARSRHSMILSVSRL